MARSTDWRGALLPAHLRQGDTPEGRRAIVASAILWVLLITDLAVVVALFANGKSAPLAPFFAAVVLSLMYALLRGHLTLVVHGIAALIAVALAGSCWLAGEIVPFLHGLAAIPLFVLFMGGKRAGALWCAIALAEVAVLKACEVYGWFPPTTGRSLPTISIITNVAAIAAVGYAYESARQNSEERVRAQAAESQATLRAIPDALYRLDERRRILVGELGPNIPPSDAGVPFAEVVGADCDDAIERAHATSAEQEVDCDTDEGSAVRIRLVPLPDGHTLALVRDMSDARHMKAQLERAKLLAQLERVNRLSSAGVLAACMAHEINNPLAYLVGNLTFLRSRLTDGFDAEMQSALEDAGDAADRIAKITSDLRQYTRDEETEPEELELAKVVRLALKLAQTEIKQRASVELRLGPGVPRVVGVESRLVQVLLNLLINAAQALPRGDVASHQITVETSVSPEGDALVTVTDTGSGIPPELLARVTEPFFTTKDDEGTGLGLAVCDQIVRQMGGSIEFTSTTGQGTTVRVSLPPANIRKRTRSSTRSAEFDATEARGNVLVVDDEPLVRRALRRLLPGHDVTEASGGLEALARFERGEEFDVILCDLMMPDLNGLDLYTQLVEKWPPLAQRTVLMTGGAFERRTQDLINTFEEELLVLDKPFDTKQLRDVVYEVMERSAQTESAASLRK